MSFYDSTDAIYGTGVYGSASYGRVSPLVAITGVQGTSAVGVFTINATVFDYEAVKELYKRTRTVHVPTRPTRTATVRRTATSQERKVGAA